MPNEDMMKIAVIGGGRRCAGLLKMLDARRFPRLRVQVVAVADLNDDAEGMVLARNKGIPTTKDYREFFNMGNLDLVVELTSNEALLEEFLRNKPEGLRILEANISRLFSDIILFQEQYLRGMKELELVQGIVESIFSNIQDRVLIVRPDFIIVDANEAMLQSASVEKEEIVGRFCYQISHCSINPCNSKGHRCPLTESIETGKTAYAIHEHFDRNNEPRTCEVTVVPLKNAEGVSELFLEVMRDITDELERRVEERTHALTSNLARLIHEDKMIALGKLVASAVHEINNPLTGIHALARLVSQGLGSRTLSEENLKQYKYYLDLIDTESARCGSIVGNLLSFARQQKMERVRFHLNEVIQRVATLFSHKMQIQGIKLNLVLAGDLPQLVGDPGQIQQCLVNLIFNAMEAMGERGAITVRTSWEKANSMVRLEVEDTGCGIPKRDIPYIFEPFFSSKSQDRGTGLGLSVVYGIIKEHQGSIYVKSEEGKGSNFIIRFFVIESA